LKILIELGEPDLIIAAEALRSHHEYVKAILRVAEKSTIGCEIEESIQLLGRAANAIERARQALIRYRECVTVEAANEEIVQVPKGEKE
jgi:hypothetical protein